MGIYRTGSSEAGNVPNAPTGFFNIFLNDSGVLMKKDYLGAVTPVAGSGGIYDGDGSLNGERIITMAPYTLRFDGTSLPGLFSLDGSSNRVGVGTVAPSSQLHIKGSSTVTIVLDTGALGLDDLTPGGTFNHQSDISYRVKIDGIGTPDTFTWSADGGTTWAATGVAITGLAQTLNYGTTVTFGATTGHTINNYWDFNGIANNPLKCSDEAGTDIMAVTNDEKVGIGTITPSYKLHVSDSLAIASIAPIVQIHNDQNTALDQSILAFSLDDDADTEIVYGCVSGEIQDPAAGAPIGNLKFKVNTSGTITEYMTIFGATGGVNIDNSLIVGNNTIDTSAILECQSTTKGLLLPRMTEAQRDLISGPAEGLTLYNLDTEKINFRDSGAWRIVTST